MQRLHLRCVAMPVRRRRPRDCDCACAVCSDLGADRELGDAHDCEASRAFLGSAGGAPSAARCWDDQDGYVAVEGHSRTRRGEQPHDPDPRALIRVARARTGPGVREPAAQYAVAQRGQLERDHREATLALPFPCKEYSITAIGDGGGRHPLVVVFMHFPWCVKWAKRPNAINVQSEFNQARPNPSPLPPLTPPFGPNNEGCGQQYRSEGEVWFRRPEAEQTPREAVWPRVRLGAREEHPGLPGGGALVPDSPLLSPV